MELGTRPGPGCNIFLALVDDESHELIPRSHREWRTDLERDVLLRFAAPRLREEPGHIELWDGESTLPQQTVVRLKAGECMLRDGKTIHRGHAQPGERLTLAGGESLSLRVAVVFTQPLRWFCRLERPAFCKRAEAKATAIWTRRRWHADRC